MTKEFTIVAIYEDNGQRFSDAGHGATVTDAVIDVIKRCRDDNNNPSEELDICAVFEGDHPSQDVTVDKADERPKGRRSRSKKKLPFTVVRNNDVIHVEAANAVEAERDEIDEVAGVFSGHLMDLSHEIDWGRVEAETEVQEEDED